MTKMVRETLEILWENRTGFCAGLIVTFQLAAITWFVGLSFGIGLGVLAERWPLSVGRAVGFVSSVLAAIPALVLIFWAYFPLQMLLGIDISPFWTAAGTLVLVNLISVADIIRRNFADFPGQYRDAALVCGLSGSKRFCFIEFPLILRKSIPPLLLLQVSMLHFTLFASLISVEDVFRVAQRLNSTLYRPVEIYSAVALLFLVLSLPIQCAASYIQSRIGVTLKER